MYNAGFYIIANFQFSKCITSYVYYFSGTSSKRPTLEMAGQFPLPAEHIVLCMGPNNDLLVKKNLASTLVKYKHSAKTFKTVWEKSITKYAPQACHVSVRNTNMFFMTSNNIIIHKQYDTTYVYTDSLKLLHEHKLDKMKMKLLGVMDSKLIYKRYDADDAGDQGYVDVYDMTTHQLVHTLVPPNHQKWCFKDISISSCYGNGNVTVFDDQQNQLVEFSNDGLLSLIMMLTTFMFIC